MTASEKKQLEDDALEYRDALLVEIQNELAVNGKTSEEAFADRVTEELEQSELVDDYTPAFFDHYEQREKKHYHINGYSFSAVDGFLNVFVTKFDGDEEPVRMGLPDIRPDVEAALNFIKDRNSLKLTSSEATDYLDCIEIINSHMGTTESSIRKFRVYLLTDGIVTDNAKRTKFPDIETKPVELLIYDIRSIYGLSIADEGRGTLQIDFSEYRPRVVHCVPAGESKDPNRFRYSSYMGVVPGVVLADIYDEHGARLLEGNVRSFLSTKGAVNKRIRETILRTPEQFFAFNNGISVTASNVRFDEEGNLAYAEEFQIINGGQTTASISNARFCDHADLSKINVLMKLTVTHDGMFEDDKQALLRTISRASNQQNKVSDADFFSTHPFHVQIEKIAEMTPAPSMSSTQLRTYWFYERARGQYTQKQMKLTRAQKDAFKKEYPPKQKITKTDLAKYRYSWDEKPYSVSKGAQSNFQAFAQKVSTIWEKGANDRARYNIQYFKETVALAIMFKGVEDLVSEQDWYTGSFRANIVTYSIAMLHNMLARQFPDRVLNLDQIWRMQELPPVLLKLFKKITKQVYDEIVNERSGVTNYTQRCKQKGFWETMPDHVDVNMSGVASLQELLVSKDHQIREEKKARIVGKMLSGVELQRKVMSKGPSFWMEVQNFAYSSKKVGVLPKEQSALTSIIRSHVPQDFTCKLLQQVLRRCQENGFIGEL